MAEDAVQTEKGAEKISNWVEKNVMDCMLDIVEL